MTQTDVLTKQLNFHMTGEGFENKEYDLKQLTKALTSVQGLVEKTYLYLNDKDKFTKSDEKKLAIHIKDIRPGSFQATLDVVMNQVILPVTPLLTAMSPEDIWNLIKESFDYLKVVLDARKKGEKVNVENNGDRNIFVSVNGSGNTLTFNGITPDLSKNLSPCFMELSKTINSDGVDSVMISDTKVENGILIDESSRDIFKNQPILEKETTEICAVITAIDGDKYSGIFKVENENNDVPQGSYRFSFIDTDTIPIDELRDAFMNERHFTCLLKKKLNAKDLTEEIVELKVVDMNKVA